MTSLCNVVLPIQAGPITLNVQFLVVDDLSPCNAIMGCAWLHRMKVIPSYVPSDDELPHGGGINRSPWHPTS